VAYRQGDAAAQSYFAESLAAFCRVPYPEGIADALSGLAALALRERRWELSARLFGAAAGIRARVGDHLLTTDRDDHAEQLDELHAQLGETTFAVAWSAGQATPLEQLLAMAVS
jgi:hypothetical protein